ncbi:MAG TPA: UPF0149 family protein [Polyangiaceae bacterium]|jgi:uncharacterized protein|nr:UPF0149 family protein [Polyangiaceae bacterium]
MLQRTQIGPLLTTEDLDAIDDLLAEFDRGIEWTTGFLCAVVSGPDLIKPSGWLPSLMGEGAFDDLVRAQAGLELLMRLYNHVCSRLATDVASLSPPPENVDEIALFCDGYLAGARLHRAWVDDAALAPLFVFAALAGEVEVQDEDIVAREGEEAKPDPESWKRRHRENLPDSVAYLYDYWNNWRRDRPLTSRLKAMKIGRNDPCPCGSGKKYKKCCLQ